jgi:hypothetical protein
MRFDLLPYNKPFHLILDLQVLRPVNLRLSIFDSQTKRIYTDRNLKLKTNKKMSFKLPIVPDQLTVELIDKNLPRMNSVFRIAEIIVIPDTKCPLDLTKEDKQFIKFAKWFACESTRLEAGRKGTIYQADDFTILFVDRIIENGIELTTPARISKEAGIIQVSKVRTLDYTVPMLIVMLLHEYAHKFKNKQFGKKESNELTADLIACHIALNLGFDSQEVRHCFEEVFERKNNKLNKNRLSAINEFITIFKNSEKARCKVRR